MDRPVMRHDSGAPLPDGDLPDGTDCSEVAGFRRCAADQCPYLCPGRVPVRCNPDVPLCLPRDDDRCKYDIGELSGPVDACSTAFPCLFSGESPPEDEQPGTCVPLDAVDLCLTDHASVDLPAFHCRWTDMTLVTRAPPDVDCPADVDSRAPYCGGSCTDAACAAPSNNCFGVSDTRGFGVCVYGVPCYYRPSTEAGRFVLSLWDDCNRDPDRRPCACLVPEPQPDEAPFPRGVLVHAPACQAYRDHYPDNADCRDIDWTPLP